MGRLAVRNAVQAAIQAANISYVGSVFPARPTIVQEQDYEQTMQGIAVQGSQSGSNCVIVVNIVSDKRMRRALTGRDAVNDTNIHQVALELFFASVGGTGTTAQKDYDGVVDGLFIEIRNNPLLSAPTVVWSAGEYTAGVQHDQSAAYTTDTGLTVHINGLVRFEAYEWVAGSGV